MVHYQLKIWPTHHKLKWFNWTFLGGLLIPLTAAAYIVTVGFVLPGFGYLGEESWFIWGNLNPYQKNMVFLFWDLLSTPCCIATTVIIQMERSILHLTLLTMATVIHRQRACPSMGLMDKIWAAWVKAKTSDLYSQRHCVQSKPLSASTISALPFIRGKIHDVH